MKWKFKYPHKHTTENTKSKYSNKHKKRIFITYNGFKKTIHVPFSLFLFSWFSVRSVSLPYILFELIRYFSCLSFYFYFSSCIAYSTYNLPSPLAFALFLQVFPRFDSRWSCFVVLFAHLRHCSPFFFVHVYAFFIFFFFFDHFLRSDFLFIFGERSERLFGYFYNDKITDLQLLAVTWLFTISLKNDSSRFRCAFHSSHSFRPRMLCYVSFG